MSDLDAFLPLKTNWFHILLSLASGEQHGYGIMQEVERLTRGQLHLGPGTLYRSIQRMLVDGLIEDPRRCSFDPGAIECKTADSTSCLTAEEVAAVRRLYDGPRTSAGVQIYPGLTRGGEGEWDRLWSDPKHLGGSWEGFYSSMVFDNPAWDLATVNFDRDPALAKVKLGGILDPDNPDLSLFARRGGKLIVYHGWGDDMVPAQVSVD